MWLASTAQDAIRAVVYLAEHAGEGPVTVTAVAKALGAPRNYLSKTLYALVNAGVLRSMRGPAGGFQLAVDPAELTLARVSEPFDEVGIKRCLLGRSQCNAHNPCAVHNRWSAASSEMQKFFRTTTVAGLLDVAEKDPRRAVVNDHRRRPRAS
jgi:Rrf2 family iron-sulfur cluster assembly transcriptional regulator